MDPQNNQQSQYPQNNQRSWNNPTPPPVNMPYSPQWWTMLFQNPNMLASMMSAMNGQQFNPMANQANQQYNPPAPQNVPPQAPVQNAPVPNTVNQISSARVITSTQDILPSELPVDNNIRLFMTDDLQTVYGKKWNNNGELDNMVFQRVNDTVPVQEAQNVEEKEDRLASLESRMNSLIEATTLLANKVEGMAASSATESKSTSNASHNKKGVNTNG